MNNYFLAEFSDNGYVFHCLLRVDPILKETDLYIIRKVIYDGSDGRLTFKEISNRYENYIMWYFSLTKDHPRYSAPREYSNIEYEDGDFLIDFEDDQEALLWYKLNY